MQLTAIVEALLIASHQPLDSKQLASIVRSHISEMLQNDEISDDLNSALKKLATTNSAHIDSAIDSLNASYTEQQHAFTIIARNKGWKIFTRPEFSGFIRQLFPDQKPQPLSAPAMETLSIIAYRQPITKAAIEAVRGVSCDGMIHKLLDKELISIAGRADLPGRPLLYQTSDHFLDYFGLRSIDDLPNAHELRSAPIPKPTPTKEKNSTDDAQNTTSTSDSSTTK